MRTLFLLPTALAALVVAARADISTDNLGPATPPSAPAATSSGTTSAATSTSPAAPSSAGTVEATRVQALQERFNQAKAVEAQGQLVQARSMFDAIIADAPDAKGSLREAGLISMELDDNLKADDYFSKLHALVPDYPMAIESLIQVNQALRHDARWRSSSSSSRISGSRARCPNPTSCASASRSTAAWKSPSPSSSTTTSRAITPGPPTTSTRNISSSASSR